MTLARALLTMLLTVPLAGFGGVERLLAPSADLWDRWVADRPESPDRIDHAQWDRILRTYTAPGPINRFRYSDVSPADREALAGYLRELSATRIGSYSRKEQLPYWINLYNALTVHLVLDRYPIASIRDIRISPGLFAIGPWDKALVTVEGVPITLNDIEHRILRPIWKDPRMHYALNCASLGCPSLQSIAFTADNSERLLDQAAQQFINGHGVRIVDDRLTVSSIYAWFTEDFGGNEAGVITHLRRYAAPNLLDKLAGLKRIEGHEYNWQLNDARHP